jgi:hypothetical protein
MPGIQFESYGTEIGYGIHPGLPEQTYRDLPASNFSFAKLLNDPAITRAHLLCGSGLSTVAPHIAAPGTVAHVLTWEPHRQMADPPAIEVYEAQTRQGNFHERRQEVEPFGTTLVTRKEWDAGAGAAEGVKNNQQMRWFIDDPDTDKELSILVRDAQYGIDLKGRIDGYNHKHKIMVDLKTCKSAAPLIVHDKIYEFSYHIQLAWYERCANLAGLDVEKWAIFWAEKKPPFATHITVFSEEAKEFARQELHRLLAKVKADIETEEPTTGWPVWTSIEPPKGANTNP